MLSSSTGCWDNMVSSKHSQRSKHLTTCKAFLSSFLQESSLLWTHNPHTFLHSSTLTLTSCGYNCAANPSEPLSQFTCEKPWTLGNTWSLQCGMDWWSLHLELAGCSILCYPAPTFSVDFHLAWKHTFWMKHSSNVCLHESQWFSFQWFTQWNCLMHWMFPMLTGVYTVTANPKLTVSSKSSASTSAPVTFEPTHWQTVSGLKAGSLEFHSGWPCCWEECFSFSNLTFDPVFLKTF